MSLYRGFTVIGLGIEPGLMADGTVLACSGLEPGLVADGTVLACSGIEPGLVADGTVLACSCCKILIFLKVLFPRMKNVSFLLSTVAFAAIRSRVLGKLRYTQTHAKSESYPLKSHRLKRILTITFLISI